jgi:hypothetical protein
MFLSEVRTVKHEEVKLEFQIPMEAAMHPVLVKTFGGLSTFYYFRQFAFGLIFPAFVYLMTRQSGHPIPLSLLSMMVVNTLLYPYSRFVYESVVNFIVGDNVFFVNAVLLLATKLGGMVFCWVGAIFIAPVGLAYLYFHHSRAHG